MRAKGAFTIGRERRKQMLGRSFSLFKKAKTSNNAVFADGAGGGSRTHTVLLPRDFKSRASAIPPHQHIEIFVLVFLVLRFFVRTGQSHASAILHPKNLTIFRESERHTSILKFVFLLFLVLRLGCF